jgi:branched-chain amino acid transport system substrate-binding protein
MQFPKRSGKWAYVGLIGWCFAFLVAGSGFARAAEPAGTSYEINVILSLTGPGTFIGTAYRNSLRALEAVTNQSGGIHGVPLRFTIVDDQSSPQVALQLAGAITAKGVPLMLGPNLAATCRAVEPTVAKSGPVAYCLSPSIYPAPNSYVFSAGVSNRDFTAVLLRYVRLRGIRRIALLATTDSSGQAADQDFPALVALPENKDLSIVAFEHFAPGDTSVAAQLAKIKATQPQLVVVWAPGTPFGTALRGMRDIGFEVPVATTSANMSLDQMKQYGAFLPKEMYFMGPGYLGGSSANRGQQSAQNTFFAAMRANSIFPDLVTGFAWDPGVIVVDALRKLGTGASAAQIHDYIESVRGLDGISGTYDFSHGDQRGVGENSITVLRWDEAHTRWLSVSGFGGKPL